MEKHMFRWTHRLGIACPFIAVLWRALNALGSVVPLSALNPGLKNEPSFASTRQH